MLDKFYEVTVYSKNALDFFKPFVFELGITCIEEKEDCFIVRDSKNLKNIVFGLLEYKKALEKNLNIPIDLDIKTVEKENKDWIEEYKKSVKDINVGKFHIRPSWIEKSGNLIDVIVDPSLAFGSGHHESTNMCLELISEFATKDKTALDVGCGSGVLSIALCKLGLNVDACDTDGQAIIATKQNALNNSVKLNDLWTGSISNIKNNYDIIIANIIADVILILHNDLKKNLKIGGVLILSGILDKYLDRVKDCFSDFEILKIEQKNEWVSIALINRG